VEASVIKLLNALKQEPLHATTAGWRVMSLETAPWRLSPRLATNVTRKDTFHVTALITPLPPELPLVQEVDLASPEVPLAQSATDVARSATLLVPALTTQVAKPVDTAVEVDVEGLQVPLEVLAPTARPATLAAVLVTFPVIVFRVPSAITAPELVTFHVIVLKLRSELATPVARRDTSRVIAPVLTLPPELLEKTRVAARRYSNPHRALLCM